MSNSPILKFLRYILVIPFQLILLGIYTWGVSSILIFLAGLLIGKSWGLFIILFFILIYVYSIIEYFIFILQVIFNFSSIKLSPNVKFGKISLFCIGLIYTAYTFYGIWFNDALELGMIWKIVISYLYIHFVTKGIVMMTTIKEFYDSMNEAWKVGEEVIITKYRAMFPNNNCKFSDENPIVLGEEDKVHDEENEGQIEQHIKTTSSGTQFLFIFGIIGFAIYGGQGNILGWVISILLLVGLIVYTKKGVNKKTHTKKRNLEYFIIPLWRFIIMQFLTAGLFGLYWNYRNLKYIAESKGKQYQGGNLGLSIFGPFVSILGNFWKSKTLINVFSLILNIVLSISPLIFISIQVKGKEDLLGILMIMKAMDFIVINFHNLDIFRIIGLGVVTGGIIFIFYVIISIPVFIGQSYAKKYHKKYNLPEYSKGISKFEIITWILMILVLVIPFLGEKGEKIEEDKKVSINKTATNIKESLIWNKYISSTGSFEIVIPCDVKYERNIDKENETKIDVYKCEINNKIVKNNVDIVFMIVNGFIEKGDALKGVGIKEIYELTIKNNQDFKNATDIKFEEKSGEGFYSFKVGNTTMKGRLIKSSNQSFYNVSSYYPDNKNSELATKFIDSFTYTGK